MRPPDCPQADVMEVTLCPQRYLSILILKVPPTIPPAASPPATSASSPPASAHAGGVSCSAVGLSILPAATAAEPPAAACCRLW